MKKYLVKQQFYKGDSSIEQVEAVRETASRLVLAYESGGKRERMVAKKSSYENYFDSWDEAWSFAIDQQKKKIDFLEGSIMRERKIFDQILRIQKPEDAQ